MNYGIPNDCPQPIIAPSTSVPLCERIRPAWLCIDSPEHCRSGISEKDIPELSEAEIAEAEAEELRRETAEAIRKEIDRDKRDEEAAQRRREYQNARYEISRKRQREKHCEKIVEILHGIRDKRRISRRSLAKELDCSAQSIANWECGRFAPSLKIQARILAMQ